ncbi:N-acetylmuramoyl-L-alanine amidase [Bacillus sp. MB353a]|nr:N-acetylmuramoyl-L-alanine amidase [Bacillus sp. MB353a]OWW10556.1 N-acetylmuramoyl-L-alanine amidase [Bacillus sp. MB353a]
MKAWKNVSFVIKSSIFLLCLTCMFFIVPSTNASAETVKIYLDPGHGETDTGAIGNGLKEKDLTLDIALQIRNILNSEYTGHEIRMSRTSDVYPTLAQRTNDANQWGANFFLSVHINSGGGTGYEDYSYPNVGAPTTTYQQLIHQEIMKTTDFVDRGMKTSNFHVLRETNMPAILTENGFIDRAEDAAKLANADFREQLARGHVNGLVKSFNLQKKTFLLRVKAPELYYYNQPDWNAKAGTVKQGDVFTVVETLTVNGSKMYKLKSGNYITANAAYVEIIN